MGRMPSPTPPSAPHATQQQLRKQQFHRHGVAVVTLSGQLQTDSALLQHRQRWTPPEKRRSGGNVSMNAVKEREREREEERERGRGGMKRRTDGANVSLLMFVCESPLASPRRPSATNIPLSIFISPSFASLLPIFPLRREASTAVPLKGKKKKLARHLMP